MKKAWHMEGLCKLISAFLIYFQERDVHKNQVPVSNIFGYIQDFIPSPILTLLVLREGFAVSPEINYKSFLYHTITGKILILTPYQPEMLNQMYLMF